MRGVSGSPIKCIHIKGLTNGTHECDIEEGTDPM